MDLISRRIQQFNDAINSFMKGDLTAEKAQVLVALSNAQHKWVSTNISLYQINKQGLINARKLKAMENKNLYDENTAIDMGLGDPEWDKVRCPLGNELIARHECLDYSGMPIHFDDCKGCEVGRAPNNDRRPPHPYI